MVWRSSQLDELINQIHSSSNLQFIFKDTDISGSELINDALSKKLLC